jgi:hypothetical protein
LAFSTVALFVFVRGAKATPSTKAACRAVLAIFAPVCPVEIVAPYLALRPFAE